MTGDTDQKKLAEKGRTVLKDEPEATVEVLGTGSEAVVRKTYRNRGLRWWQSFGRRSRAHREFVNLQHVARTGAHCPTPLCWSARTRLGFVAESTLITRYLPDSRSLKALLADPQTAGRLLRRILAPAAGRLLATMHQHGVLWCTPMPRNILVLGDPTLGRLAVCDTPLAVSVPRSLHATRMALIDLFDAAFSPSRKRDYSATDRMRWLLGYCNGDRQTARRLWRSLASRTMLWHDLSRALTIFWRVYLLGPLQRLPSAKAPST